MARGVIRYFNDRRGYGFIEARDGDASSIYVHHSKIAGTGYRTLRPGDVVEFDLDERSGGREAARVIPVRRNA